jgi:flavin reductase (DIM6/NTAB) family NADH-FMN oxidoreductase RutF
MDDRAVSATGNGRSEETMIDLNEFRRLFQAQVSTVTVVTAQHGQHRAGLTATAVCSLQDDPPSLVVSVNRSSTAYRLIAQSRQFAVNLLNDQQEAVASRFARHAADLDEAARKFEDAGRWSVSDRGIPLLEDAVAAAECEVVQIIELKTHAILIGQIVAAYHADGEIPLLYGNRQYASLRHHQPV